MFQKNIPKLGLFFALCLPLLGFGCGQRAAEETLEHQINQQLGDQGRVDVQGENWQYKDAASGTQVTVGQSVPVPDDFPKDLPLFEPGELRAVSINPAAGQSAYAMLLTAASSQSVVDWYKVKLAAAGWTAAGNFSLEGNDTLMYRRGDQALTISVAPSGEAALATAITLILANQ